MESFTIYIHKTTDAFRVVAGEHNGQSGEYAGDYRVTVFTGHDKQSAAFAAYSSTTRADIKAQIERFLPDLKLVTWPAHLSPHFKWPKCSGPLKSVGHVLAPLADTCITCGSKYVRETSKNSSHWILSEEYIFASNNPSQYRVNPAARRS